MVHLNAASRVASPKPGGGLPSIVTPNITTTVYGSRFAMEDLPRHRMPEDEMPREVAYRMIKDELSLDGNPKMNLASFVTTYMEEEAEKLMAEALPKNFIDYEEYPQTADLQHRCVNMLADLFHAPTVPAAPAGSGGGGDSVGKDGGAVGTSTVGSSEAIMLAVLAMKRRWANRTGNDPSRRPNLIMSSAVQVCWEKAARYLDVEARLVDVDHETGRFVLDPEQAVGLCDDDTIGLCLILGTTYTGEYEDVKAVNDLLVARGISADVGIHVDAASGGFVAPFVVPDLEWDFRLERVVSINVSGHKYGLVYPGVGWVLFRSAEYLPADLVFNINYLGADQATFTLNFSKGASHVIAQYYQLVRLGRAGYACIMANLTQTADYLSSALRSMGFVILSKGGGDGLPVVAFRFFRPDEAATEQAIVDDDDDDADGRKTAAGGLCPSTYDEFALAHQLRARGWIVPAYTMAPKAEDMKLLRIVVRADMSRGRCDILIADIRMCVDQLEEMEEAEIERHKSLTRSNTFSAGRRNTFTGASGRGSMSVYSNEVSTGKTRAIC